jgi:hypothetical protein
MLTPWRMFSAQMLLPDSIDTVEDAFNQLGPIPRLCIDFSVNQHELDLYKQSVERAFSYFRTDQILQLASEATSLSMDAVFHKNFLIGRQKLDIMDSPPTVAPITDLMKSRLAIRFRALDQRELVELYHLFSGD